MMEDCDICFLKYQYTNMTGLQCGHRFCKACWIEYLTTKIMEEGLCKSIACAAHGCDILVDDVTVMNLLTEPRVRTKYQQLITNSFVECNRLLRWCPSADCSYAVKVQYVDARPVECKCGHVFCFECGEQWHDPVQCRLLRRWIKKCDDDSETSNWIAANTKECPKCNVTIEKDGGCNHMVSSTSNKHSLSDVNNSVHPCRSARTNTASTTSAGSVLDRGSRTEALGTTAIATMRTKLVPHEMHKRN